MKDIKYWRFGMYSSYETAGKIPDNLELFCLNPDTTYEDSNGHKNYSYFGIIPYDEDVWQYYQPIVSETENSTSVSYETSLENCDIQNLNNKYIIFYFDQIYFLSEFNETTVFPNIPKPEYIKVRAKKIADYTDTYKEFEKTVLANANQMDFNDEGEKYEYIINQLYPITNYIKLNGFIHAGSEVDYDCIDIYRFSAGFLYIPTYVIQKTSFNHTKYLHDLWFKVIPSNKEEFDIEFELMLNNLK